MYRYSVCVGTNLSAMPVSFAAWDKRRFRREVVNFMTEYLQTAYSKCETQHN
jgi:hypothetical protein